MKLNPMNFRIRTKFAGAVLAVTLLFTSVSFYTINLCSEYMEQSYGENMIDIASTMLNEMADLITNKVELLHVFCEAQHTRFTLKQSNDIYSRNPHKLDTIKELDAKGGVQRQDMMLTVTHTDLSMHLRESFMGFFQKNYGFKVFGEVFITNRFGVNIGQTGLTEDLLQADEEWWQVAMERGSYYGGIDWDTSVGGYAAVIAFRITDANGAPLGVVKALLMAQWITREAEQAMKQRSDLEIRLSTDKGKLLYSSRPFQFMKDISQTPYFAKKTARQGYFITQVGGRDMMFSYDSSTRRRLFGKSRWVLFVAIDLAEITKPIASLRNNLVFVYGVGFSMILLIALLVAQAITTPLEKLNSAALAIARGDLDEHVDITGADELGELARAFNDMTEKLKETYKVLEEEIIEHQELQDELNIKTVELELQAKELARSNQELQDFAYIASHDLQEPLRKVIAFGERLREKEAANLSERGHDYLIRMENSAQRMSNLIDSLLEYSRITTKALPFEEIELGRVVLDVLSDLETRISSTRAQVDIGHFPVIEAEPIQMRQLLQNLISNALKFQRPEARPEISITSTLAGRNKTLCQITVKDNGIGFDEKYLDRIFKPFQRLHGRTEFEGNGMGMAICNKIVHRHHGAMTAESAPGKGASFIVTLPLRQTKG